VAASHCTSVEKGDEPVNTARSSTASRSVLTRRPRLSVLAAVAGVLALVLVLAPGVLAQSGAPLTGQYLEGPTTSPSAFRISSKGCRANGDPAFSYVARGMTVGPYPGTFTERGTVSFSGPEARSAPGELGGRPVASASASFRIEAGSTVITGTKEHAAPAATGYFADRGTCSTRERGSSPGTTDSVAAFNTGFTYRATICKGTDCSVQVGTASTQASEQLGSVKDGAPAVRAAAFRAQILTAKDPSAIPPGCDPEVFSKAQDKQEEDFEKAQRDAKGKYEEEQEEDREDFRPTSPEATAAFEDAQEENLDDFKDAQDRQDDKFDKALRKNKQAFEERCSALLAG